jgi:hypothetical protein
MVAMQLRHSQAPAMASRLSILGILAQVLLFRVYFTSKHSALLFATHDVHFSLLI